MLQGLFPPSGSSTRALAGRKGLHLNPYTMHIRLMVSILFFMAGLSVPGTSQSYTPFYLQHARWTMEAIYPVLGPGDGHAYWEIYTLGDTLIEGEAYHLLATRNLCEKWPDGKGGHNYAQTLNTSEFVFGALREMGQRVYFLRLNPMPSWKVLQSRLTSFPIGTEHLLYDFSAGEGDTVYYSDLTFWTVTNGDTTFITRSHFSILFESTPPSMGHGTRHVANNTAYFFPHEKGLLIEGVGSSYGFFGPYDSFLTYLRCFQQDGQPMIYTGGCDPCQGMPTSVDAGSEVVVQLFPNPASQSLYVRVPGGSGITRITVTDMRGRIVLRQDGMASEVQLDLSMLSRGMAVVLVQLDNGVNYQEKILLH
jgi:hypothetical protein